LGLAALAGGSLLILLTPAGRQLAGRFRPWLWLAWGVGGGGLISVVLCELSEVNPAFAGRILPLSQAGSQLGTFLNTQVGHNAAWSMGFLLLTALLLLLGRRSAMFAVFPAFAAYIATGFTSHAAASGSTLLLASELLHLSATGAWFGGLLVLVFALGMLEAVPALRLGKRFSALALVAMIVLVASGLINTLKLVPSPHLYVDSSYGLDLIVKHALIVGVIVLAAFNRQRNIPRGDVAGLRRTSRGEAVVAACIVTEASLLATTSPPETGLFAMPDTGFPVLQLALSVAALIIFLGLMVGARLVGRNYRGLPLGLSGWLLAFVLYGLAALLF
jgi:putative copper export protein